MTIKNCKETPVLLENCVTGTLKDTDHGVELPHTSSPWGNPMTAQWASSISILHPCIELTPYDNPLPDPLDTSFSVFGLSKNAPIFQKKLFV